MIILAAIPFFLNAAQHRNPIRKACISGRARTSEPVPDGTPFERIGGPLYQNPIAAGRIERAKVRVKLAPVSPRVPGRFDPHRAHVPFRNRAERKHASSTRSVPYASLQ